MATNRRVLLVEDEAPIARTLSRAIGVRGYDVATCEGGLHAVAAIVADPPDILLLDVSLPDITGWEVLRRLTPAERARFGLIVYSASPLAPDRVAEFRPDGVLVKPFPIDALVRLIAEIAQSQEEKNRA